MIRGEILIELEVSWLIMKTIVVEQSINHNIEYSTRRTWSRKFIKLSTTCLGMLLI